VDNFKVLVCMGSSSDWNIMKDAVSILKEFSVNVDYQVLSAHRCPEEMLQMGKTAHEKGYQIIIAGAGGAAHLPGMLASASPLPVIGVPIKATHLDGMDSLLSIVQMPKGVPVATVGINKANNAALLAVKILATQSDPLRDKIIQYKAELKKKSHAQQSDLIF
jgi:5-(carboxyamino)imidazole ribonucleotide mutase